jgi:hypothetical protein
VLTIVWSEEGVVAKARHEGYSFAPICSASREYFVLVFVHVKIEQHEHGVCIIGYTWYQGPYNILKIDLHPGNAVW